MKFTRRGFIVVAIITFVIIAATWLFFAFKGIIPADYTGDLTKANWLGFWGSVLGFAGTVYLGSLALLQNKRLDDANRKLAKINAETVRNNLVTNGYSDILINRICFADTKILIYAQMCGAFPANKIILKACTIYQGDVGGVICAQGKNVFEKLVRPEATFTVKKSPDGEQEYLVVFEFTDNEIASFVSSSRRFDEKPDFRFVFDWAITNAIGIDTYSTGEIILKAQMKDQPEDLIIDPHLGLLQLFSIFDYFISGNKIVTHLDDIVYGNNDKS